MITRSKTGNQPTLLFSWQASREALPSAINTNGSAFLDNCTPRFRIAKSFFAFQRELPLPSSSSRFAIMPRRSSGGRSAARAPVRNPPQPASRAPPPAHPHQSNGGGMLSGIGSTIAQGMAFGTGSAVAHRAVDAVLGPRTIQHETVVSESSTAPAGAANSTSSSDACGVHSKAFQDCINHNGSDISKCQFYLDMLSECRRNSGSISA